MLVKSLKNKPEAGSSHEKIHKKKYLQKHQTLTQYRTKLIKRFDCIQMYLWASSMSEK